VILVLDLLLQLAKLVHQTRDLGDSIVMLKYTIEGATSILILVLFAGASLCSNQFIQKILNISIVSCVEGQISHTVLD